MAKFKTIVGLDPGVSGGISILRPNGDVNIYKIPVVNTMVNKKNKKVYDVPEIVKLLKPLKGKVLFVQEKVASHPGEGSVSAFGFGKSSGLTIGIASALGFEVIEVSSTLWKKAYPQLVTALIQTNKDEIKKLRAKGKTLKDAASKKANKKEIDKLNRQIKSEAKTAAREYAASLYPDFRDCLKHKNSDGVAESLLIALYGRDNQDELV